MFMQIAVSAIGIAIVLMVGYLVVAQVETIVISTASYINEDVTNTTTIVYAGFALIAVGVIVLAAFGLITVFS